MTIYEVTAWCAVPHYTTFEVDAESIGKALEKARSHARTEYGEPCSGIQPDWDEFEITSGAESLTYLEPARLAANAADIVFQTLKEVSLALKHYAHWQPTMPEHLTAIVEAAIHQATHQQGDKP